MTIKLLESFTNIIRTYSYRKVKMTEEIIVHCNFLNEMYIQISRYGNTSEIYCFLKYTLS